MAAPKRNGGRPVSRAAGYLIWAFLLTLLGLLLFHISGSAHRRASSSRGPPGDGEFLATPGNYLFPSTTGDVTDDGDDPPLLREMLAAVNLCRTSTIAAANGISKDGGAQTFGEDCRKRLLRSHPSLKQPSSVRPPPNSSTSSSRECVRASQDTLRGDERRIKDLEHEVTTLSAIIENSTVFRELISQNKDKDSGFMRFVMDPRKREPDAADEVEFPSELSLGRMLCLKGNSRSNGTQNRYGFAWKGHLPPNATLLRGLTFVTDNDYDYENLWHAMSALVSFVSWRERNRCAVPERLLLYHLGELVPTMGSWIHSLLHATFGRRLEVEALDHFGGEPVVCLERAVVNRRGLSGMSVASLNTLFETVRCRARMFCRIGIGIGGSREQSKGSGAAGSNDTRVVLFLRSGARAFTNVTAVTRVVRSVCEEFRNCHLEVAHADNLSFCDQVALMSRSDILITTHGAQLTNAMFMDKGSSVMELYPKGWKDLAGIGQYIYTWLADWANLRHEGQWRDPEGPDCPFPAEETLNCFLFYKDRQVGLNATHMDEWTRRVVGNFTQRSIHLRQLPSSKDCACASVDSTL